MRRLRALCVFALIFAAGAASAVTLRVALPLPEGGASAWRTLGDRGRPLFLAAGDGLLAFDASGAVKLGLADGWTVEGKTWTFALKAARWADGSPITAKDFADAWRQAGVQASFDTSDSRKLRATFAQPIADPAVFTRPEYLLWPDAARLGCGPFLIESVAGNTLALKKNPSFREAKSILLDRLEFWFFASMEDASALYRDGRLDWVPWGGGPGVYADRAKKNAVVSPGWGSLFLRLNLGAARLGDAEFRRSLNDAIDRTSLFKELRGPLLLPATNLIPRTAPAAPSKPLPRRLGPRPEPVLTILYPQGETYRLIADALAAAWKSKLGIAVETKSAAYARVKADRASGAYEVSLSSWLGDYPDASTFLGLFRSGAPDNATGFADLAYDALLDRLGVLPPGKARTDAQSQAETLLSSFWPVIPLFSYASMNQIDLRRWTGWIANPADIHPWQGVTRK